MSGDASPEASPGLTWLPLNLCQTTHNIAS